GRSSALNTAVAAAAGAIVAMTDDDVLVEPGGPDAACDALESAGDRIGYAGGPVRPMWESAPPAWLDLTRGDLWGTIAIQDHGDRPFVYEDAGKVPPARDQALRLRGRAQSAARREPGRPPPAVRRDRTVPPGPGAHQWTPAPGSGGARTV